MMITKIRLQEEHPMTGPTGTWPLPICDLSVDIAAGDNGYILKVADGLGPPAFQAVVEGFDSTGIPVMISDPQTRDVAFRIGLNPQLGQSYSELRDDLYKLISRTVFVKLMNGSKIVAQATGFIREFDSVHFSNLPEIQVIIECQDGAFSAPASIAIPIATLGTLTPVINYEEGTAPAGMDLQFTVTTNHSGFSITEYSKFWAVGGADVHNAFTITFAFLTGDVVNLSTHPKKRRLTVTRAGVTTDLAGYLNAGAIWPKLYTGVNAFTWTFASSWMTWNVASYTPRFWGV